MTAGLETFAKVRALHDRATIPGEKVAAMTRMQTLARKAGMSVEEAVSKLEAPPAATTAHRPVDMGDFFNTPYFREQMAERERERAVRWREVLQEYGTEEAVFHPGPMEQALDKAAARFGADPGWDAYPLSKVPPAIVATVEAAWAMPGTVCEAWIEFAFWEKLGWDREARGIAYGDPSPVVQIRCRILERMLDETPALSLNDLRARVSWLEFLDSREAREHGVRLATLRADIERMGARIREQDAEPVQSGHGKGSAQCAHPSDPRSFAQGSSLSEYPLASSEDPRIEPVHSGHPRRTNADKRRDVIALLNVGDAHNSRLTDREIARRAGVSPTTVGAVRRSIA